MDKKELKQIFKGVINKTGNKNIPFKEWAILYLIKIINELQADNQDLKDELNYFENKSE